MTSPNHQIGPRGFSADIALADEWERHTGPLLALALVGETASVVFCTQTTDEAGVDVLIHGVGFDLKHNLTRYGQPDDPELRLEHGLKYGQPGCDWFAHVFLDDPACFYLLSAPHLRRWALSNLSTGKGAPFKTFYSRTSATAFSPVAYSVLEGSLPPGAARIVRADAPVNGVLTVGVAVNSSDPGGMGV